MLDVDITSHFDLTMPASDGFPLRLKSLRPTEMATDLLPPSRPEMPQWVALGLAIWRSLTSPGADARSWRRKWRSEGSLPHVSLSEAFWSFLEYFWLWWPHCVALLCATLCLPTSTACFLQKRSSAMAWAAKGLPTFKGSWRSSWGSKDSKRATH